MTRGTAAAVCCVGLYAALFLLPVVIFWNQPLQPKVPVTAHVVRVYAKPSVGTIGYYRHNFWDVVVATTDTGLEGRALVDYTDDRCNVGDLVNGWQRGINIEVDPRTCRRAPSEHSERAIPAT